MVIVIVNGTMQNALYLEFRDAGFQLKLFGPALALALLASVGIPLNFTVCYITLKYRKEYETLGSPTGILIAAYSLFELLHQSGHLCFLVVTASGTNFIPARVAFRWELLALVGFLSTNNMLLLSLDRLFAVAAPFHYRNMPKPAYICLHLALICAYDALPVYGMWTALQQSPDWPVTGFISDIIVMPGANAQIGLLMNLVAMCLTIVSYLLVIALVKCKTAETSVNNALHRLYRSLGLIVGINIGSWMLGGMLTLILTKAVDKSGWTASDSWLGAITSFVILNVAAITNAPVLLINSSEYRSAYRRERQFIRRCWITALQSANICHPTCCRVAPITVTTVVSVQPAVSTQCPS